MMSYDYFFTVIDDVRSFLSYFEVDKPTHRISDAQNTFQRHVIISVTLDDYDHAHHLTLVAILMLGRLLLDIIALPAHDCHTRTRTNVTSC
jgi:hypothetical protein